MNNPGNLASYIMPAAAIGAMGYCYMWWKARSQTGDMIFSFLYDTVCFLDSLHVYKTDLTESSTIYNQKRWVSIFMCEGVFFTKCKWWVQSLTSRLSSQGKKCSQDT